MSDALARRLPRARPAEPAPEPPPVAPSGLIVVRSAATGPLDETLGQLDAELELLRADTRTARARGDQEAVGRATRSVATLLLCRARLARSMPPDPREAADAQEQRDADELVRRLERMISDAEERRARQPRCSTCGQPVEARR